MTAVTIADESSIPMTPALKGWLVANKYAADVATEPVLRRATHTALLDGALDGETLVELCRSKESEEDVSTATKDGD